MYYLIAGQMSSFYGFNDRPEMIIYRHASTSLFEDLDRAREHGNWLVKHDGEVDGWILVGPDKQATWQGAIFNDSGVPIPAAYNIVIQDRQGYDTVQRSLVPFQNPAE